MQDVLDGDLQAFLARNLLRAGAVAGGEVGMSEEAPDGGASTLTLMDFPSRLLGGCWGVSSI